MREVQRICPADPEPARNQMQKPITPPHSDPDTLLSSSKIVCMAPWVHAHLSSLGHFTPCCEIFASAAPTDSKDLDAHWNGAEMSALRLAMLGNEPLEICRKCTEKERAGLSSRRQKFNAEFRDEAHRLAATTKDGKLAPTCKPIDLDLRFSNLCNFRCRSCWHGASSRWFSDATALGQAKSSSAIIEGTVDRERTLAQTLELLPHTHSLYFAGGEPLLMQEHYALLDALLRAGRTDIKLSYNSNLSALIFNGRRVTDMWAHFNDVEVAVSVDGAGAIGELIRKGMECAELERNIREVRERSPNVKLVLAVTVSVLNVFHLPALDAYARSKLGFAPSAIRLNPLQDPPHYNIQMLPRTMKRRAAEVLANLSEMNPSIRDAADDVIAYMVSKDRSKSIPAFARITGQLDKLRYEDTFRTIPELSPLLDISHRLKTRWGRASFRLAQKLHEVLML